MICCSHLGCATEYAQEYDKSQLGLVVEWDDEGHVIENTGSEIEQGVEQPEGEPLLIVAPFSTMAALRPHLTAVMAAQHPAMPPPKTRISVSASVSFS